MSDPDLNHARAALARLSHLVVQDIFLTETGWLADVVLPASAWPEKTGTVTNTDRAVQLGRRVLDPPGDARADLWIVQQMARRLGLDWHYPGDVTTVQTHRGEVTLPVRPAEGTPAGAIFIPFGCHEAAANQLTNPALDPTARIPELEYCAVSVQPGAIERQP